MSIEQSIKRWLAMADYLEGAVDIGSEMSPDAKGAAKTYRECATEAAKTIQPDDCCPNCHTHWQVCTCQSEDVIKAMKSRPKREIVDEDALTVADYEEVLADHRRLVRELDVALNGDGAAKQASLCDIVAQVKSMKQEIVGLPKEQEPKYTTNGHAIVNRTSGEEIPADEPIFILRARDKHAVEVLSYYYDLVVDANHGRVVILRREQFHAFAKANPHRMKEPDSAPLSQIEDKESV